MADCREYEEMIGCYVDGELPEQDTKVLLAHVETCASCRALLSVYRHISEAAGDSMAEVPEGFTSGVMEKIKAMPAPTAKPAKILLLRKPIRSAIITFAAAAACLALVFAIKPQLFGGGNTIQNATLAASDSTVMEAGQPDTAGDTQDSAAKASVYQAYGTAQAPEAPADGATQKAVPDGGGADSNSAPPTDSNGDTSMGLMAAPGAGEAGSAPAPKPDTVPIVEEQTLRDYYAVFTIQGTLPDTLKNVERTANQDGTYSIVITTETAKQLIKDGYTAQLGNEKAETALVYFIAE